MKYFLSQDQSSHWYVIPALYREEWYKFNDIPTDDERSWDVPEWAVAIDHASNIEFENWSDCL